MDTWLLQTSNRKWCCLLDNLERSSRSCDVLWNFQNATSCIGCSVLLLLLTCNLCMIS